MEFKLLGGSMIAAQNEKGEWIYKANENQLKPFKKNGNLKAHYHDLPRFEVITEYEDIEVKSFEESLRKSITNISIKLLSFSK